MVKQRSATDLLAGYYKGYKDGAGHAPKELYVGPALYDAYESELIAMDRFGLDPGYGKRWLMFRDTCIHKICEGWQIGVSQ